MTHTPAHPAVATVLADCATTWMPVLLGHPPTDPDANGTWFPFTTLVEEQRLARRVQEMTPDYDGLADVATAFLASRFASPLALLAGAPVHQHGVAVAYDIDDLWLRRSPRGWFNGIALTDAVLDSTDTAAPRAVAHYRPVVERLRRVGKLGNRAMWGQLADALATTAGHAHDASGDAEAAIEGSARLLQSAEPPLWGNPVFERIEAGGAVGLAWRRSSCCLAYRCERYELCTGCPLTPTEEWRAKSIASVTQRAGSHA
ncbi:putative iron-sulfur protein [Euzebya pacifica]|uniref:Putative iron-sulfur protein n=1 Tax=Euzebya pacifica TaxID=1608957 RepID=A0A346Y3W4_9ACTN|nr:hypothetical protein [Euzebya pacifica]AXV09161.1 putative iron-sulfur protein [Euzebya pacifica]